MRFIECYKLTIKINYLHCWQTFQLKNYPKMMEPMSFFRSIYFLTVLIHVRPWCILKHIISPIFMILFHSIHSHIYIISNWMKTDHDYLYQTNYTKFNQHIYWVFNFWSFLFMLIFILSIFIYDFIIYFVFIIFQLYLKNMKLFDL